MPPPTPPVGLPPEKVAELVKLRDAVATKVADHKSGLLASAPWIVELEAIFAALNTILADVAPIIAAGGIPAPVAKP